MTDPADPSNIDLDDLSQLRQALNRLPNGTKAVRLMGRLGLWTTSAHAEGAERPAFPSSFSALSPDQLSDLSARIASDSGRVLELYGILSGLEAQLKIRARSARASARARLRRTWPEGKKAPTKAELDDLAEEDVEVRTVDTDASLLALLLAMVQAVKESNIVYKEAVSREITYRSAQMQARMY